MASVVPDRMRTLGTLRLANADGAFSTAFATLVTGGFLVGFIKELKGEGADLWLGLLTGLPAVVGLLQIPGAALGRRFRSRKGYVFPGGLLWRMFYIPVAILPLIAMAADLKLAILLGCVTLAAIVINLVNPIYSEWLAELVPENSRGAFFSTRNALATAVGTTVGMGGAVLLDMFRAQGLPFVGFSVLFGIGVLMATVSQLCFLKTHDVPRQEPERQNFREFLGSFSGPFQDREFKKVIVFLGFFLFGQGFAGNLYSAYALESLGFSFSALQALTVFHAVGNILASRAWGFLADKYGNKPCLALAGIGLVLTPIPWIFTMASNKGVSMGILYVSHLFMGAIWSGVAVCQSNLIFATSRPEVRGTYIGAGSAVSALMGGVAPLCGAMLMAAMRAPFPPDVAYKIVFGTTVAARLVGVLWLIPVRETGAAAFGTTLRHIKGITPTGLRAARSFSRSGDEVVREASIGKLADEGYALASDDLIAALHDPSPRVRRQAAAALGRLGDPKATSDLVHQLEDHPDLVEEETIAALGEIGDAAAIPILVRFLTHPRSMLRRASARALANIPGAADDPEARAALLKAADVGNDPDARRSALQALRNLHSETPIPGLVPILAAGLTERHPSVRIAAAEAVSELEIPELAPALRASLAEFRDEAGAEIAYTLGAVGEESDLPTILAFAEESVSMTTRRRCLLGAARLLGVEREAYRLLLTEGMARDRALMTILGPSRPGSAEGAAVTAYGSGDEREAMAKLPLSEAATPLRRCSAPETFLVAACVWARENGTRPLIGR